MNIIGTSYLGIFRYHICSDIVITLSISSCRANDARIEKAKSHVGQECRIIAGKTTQRTGQKWTIIAKLTLTFQLNLCTIEYAVNVADPSVRAC